MSNDNAQNAPGPRPICYMAAGVARRLKAKIPALTPNYGATTTVTIARAFADDAALYDQAAIDDAYRRGFIDGQIDMRDRA